MNRDPGASSGTLLGRAVRRKCPRCGVRPFESWFRLAEYCPGCGLRFEREPGYWVGAVIINTTVIFATFVLTFTGLLVATWPDVPWPTVLGATLVVNLIVPIVFYPMSKTMWSALELSWHALEPKEIEEARSRVG